MFRRLKRNIERHLLGKDPLFHDAYEDPAEQFYARLYLKYLFQTIDKEFRHQSLKILDFGCHTGRLSIPLARAGHQVTGVDSSRFYLKQADRHARQAGVHCRFLRGDGLGLIRRMPPESFDLIVCTEVLYQWKNFQDGVGEFLKALRPGGLLAASHRSRFFYLTQTIREKDFKTAQFLLTHSEGEIRNTYFNWQTPQELRTFYEEWGLDILLVRPIGTFSGNGGDGMAKFCNLGELAASEREALFDIEAHDSEEFAGLGRYILVIGRKR